MVHLYRRPKNTNLATGLITFDKWQPGLDPPLHAAGEVVNFIVSPYHGLGGGEGGHASGKAATIENDGLLFLDKPLQIGRGEGAHFGLREIGTSGMSRAPMARVAHLENGDALHQHHLNLPGRHLRGASHIEMALFGPGENVIYSGRGRLDVTARWQTGLH